MKHQRFILLTLLTTALLVALGVGLIHAQESAPQGQMSVQAAVGTAFTYQGRLKQNGRPVSGTCDLRFKLFDAATGGSQVGPTRTKTGVNVTNGLFTVSLDFGAGVFDGNARWLEVAARCPAGSGTYSVLSPRQPITPVPYALYSLKAPWSGLTGVPAGFADNVDDDTLAALSCSGGQLPKWNGSAWTCGEDNDTTYTAGAGLTLSGTQFSVNFAGSGSADTVARSDHNHWGETWSGSGIGLTLESTSWVGLLSQGASSGVQGIATSYTCLGFECWAYGVYGRSIYTQTPPFHTFSSYGVYGESAHPHGYGVAGYATASSGTTYGAYGKSMSPDGYGGYFENTASGGVGLYARAKGDMDADLVLGGTSRSNDNGTIYSDPAYSSSDLVLVTNDTVRIDLDNNGDGEDADFEIYDKADNRIFDVDESGEVYAEGSFHSGGADFAEMLPAGEEVEPGDVLVVGADGKLRRSRSAYATAVVGVYSTKPGFVGGQGAGATNDDRIPVAIVGVVPVKASAENGPIRPGDLLVSAGTPGHAMKAGPNPPVGTVLGKALEGLEEGRGMILMLVMMR